MRPLDGLLPGNGFPTRSKDPFSLPAPMPLPGGPLSKEWQWNYTTTIQTRRALQYREANEFQSITAVNLEGPSYTSTTSPEMWERLRKKVFDGQSLQPPRVRVYVGLSENPQRAIHPPSTGSGIPVT